MQNLSSYCRTCEVMEAWSACETDDDDELTGKSFRGACNRNCIKQEFIIAKVPNSTGWLSEESTSTAPPWQAGLGLQSYSPAPKSQLRRTFGGRRWRIRITLLHSSCGAEQNHLFELCPRKGRSIFANLRLLLPRSSNYSSPRFSACAN